MVRIGRMTDNAFVLLVEAVHRSPGEGDAIPQLTRIVGHRRVLPCATSGTSVTHDDSEPGDGTQLAMLCRPALAHEDTGSNVGGREERDRVEAGFVEQKNILAVGDPLTGEFNSQSSA